MSASSQLFGVRFDTGEVLGDLTRLGLYGARLNLQLYLSLNPHVSAEQVAILERGDHGDRYHFAAAPNATDDSVEGELARAADRIAAAASMTVEDVLAR